MQEIMNDIYKFNFLDNIYVYMNFINAGKNLK